MAAESPVTPPWPHDWQALEDRLDRQTIERQGEFWLYRGLNIKRLIAFLGSGVSMAYGRVTWKEIATLHIDTMCELGERSDLQELPGAVELVTYIKDIRVKTDSLPTDDLYPALQACEQLWRLAAASGNERLIKELADKFEINWAEQLAKFDAERVDAAERGSRLFRYWIKRETYDEVPHVKRLLCGWNPAGASGDLEKTIPHWIIEAFNDEEIKSKDAHAAAKPSRALTDSDKEAIRRKARTKLWDGILEVEEKRPLLRRRIGGRQRAYHVFFQPNFLAALSRAAPPPAGDLAAPLEAILKELGTITAQLAEGRDRDEKSLRPARGFAVALALDTARLATAMAEARESCLSEATARRRKRAREYRPSERGMVNRADLVPPEHDPLHRLAYDLGIVRYMTTNYDLEVERLFTDMGFRIPVDLPADGADIDEVESIGPSGGRARDLVLTERSAIDLVDFSANDSQYEFQVVHLHGRATEHHDIVVTEADYQRTYVRQESSQRAFRQGLDIAFGGNPILFVGLGLSEGDILRPLREFMTETARDNRAIIALRDGRQDQVKRDTFAKKAYAQYGVHVLHYGFAARENKNVDWLAQVADRVKSLLGEIKAVGEAIEAYAKALRSAKESAPASTSLGSDATTPNPVTADSIAARNAIDEKISQIEGDRRKSRVEADGLSFLEQEFISDGGDCNIRFEMSVLRSIEALLLHVARLATVPAGTIDPEKLAAHAITVKGFIDKSLRPAVERAEAAIITAALNAKLQGIKAGWIGWWRDWRSEPATRTEFVRYEKLDELIDPRRRALLNVWARHFADEAAAVRHGGERGGPTHAASSQVAKANGLESAGPDDPRMPEGLRSFFAAVDRLEVARNRRVFMLLGSRGAGKGNIYNAFALRGTKLLKTGARYAGQFFTTFSFSIEIASVWDALLAFLDDPTDNPNLFSKSSSGEKEPREMRRAALRGLSRIDILRRVLRGLAARLKENDGERVLIVLNAFDILLDENGEPKNKEIRQILRLLLGPESKDAPFDIVCISRDRRIHGLYAETAPTDGEKSSPSIGPAFESGPILKGQELALLLSNRQSMFGERVDPGDEGGRIHGDFLSSIRTMQTFVYLDKSLRDPKPWLAEELGLRFEGSPTAANYVHVLDLPDPLDFDWRQFDKDTGKRLRAAAYEAIKDAGRDPTGASDHDAALRRLFRVHLQRRRFLYTLIVAIAHLVESDAKLTRFLRNLIPSIRGPGLSVQDRVIEAVLDFWFERPEIKAERLDIKAPDEDLDPVLWEHLLRHLAVITTPITAEILALCPEIAQHLDPALTPRVAGDEVRLRARIDKIEAALRSLARRGLVFNLQPAASAPGQQSRQPNLNPRYVVHRAIQRYIFRKLGSQRLEPLESSTFTLSLYAAQQRHYPRLNAASYAFIYKLVDALSAYPSRHQRSHEDRPQAARALRAALGVTRNLLSIGVVSRFSDLDDLHVMKPAMSGYFEHHRYIVRWLLYYAQDLERKRGKLEKLSNEDAGDPRNWLPFYRDELVWLANECGVFAYSQGQTYDASAFYWLASRLQRNIESLRPGAMRSRLFLNDAWCCIDRARLDDAETMLKDVYDTADEEKVLRLVARGGLALISNIRGRTDLALAEYDQTIGEMQRMQRSRPLSILQRHRGDLKRHMRDREGAEKDFIRAIQTAETSGYIDLVHTTQVARVRNLLEPDFKDPGKLTETLDAAQSYAERMNVPRLLCEVLMVRAELLIKQGQSDVAGNFAKWAIRIATLNGLNLRKLAYLELLARIERARGNMDSAERLLARTIRSARHAGYNLMVERAERDRSELYSSQA